MINAIVASGLSVQATAAPVTVPAVKRNQVPSKVDPNRKYVLLTKSLESWGKVPQQQADIAKILTSTMEVGVHYTEQEVFAKVTAGAPLFQSISKSVQDPTYLFRYYRGLKRDETHGGFVARNFLKVVN